MIGERKGRKDELQRPPRLFDFCDSAGIACILLAIFAPAYRQAGEQHLFFPKDDVDLCTQLQVY